MNRTARSLIGLVGWVIIVCHLMVAVVFGQNRSAAESPIAFIDSYRYFDQPIDPNIYLLRPGDQLTITFINAKVSSLTLKVDPEGRIIDQTLGQFEVQNKTLAQARVLLSAALREYYDVEEIAISIQEPARVSVQVSGAVERPGLHTAYTSQRVSEIIDSAGGILATGSHRHITFEGGPTPLPVDLDRAVYLGDAAANPCLYAGYHVHVQSKSDLSVQVVGEVNDPREIEYLPGDKLELFLALAGGIRTLGDSSKIRIITHNGKPSVKQRPVEPGNIIVVPSKTEQLSQLIVHGAVEVPGTYEFHTGITLRDFVTAAGGFLDDAGRHRLTLFRQARSDEWGRISSVRYPISNLVNADGTAKEFPLQGNDSIYVPVQIGYVQVSGEVVNPGFFPFEKGLKAIAYIQAAGGFLPTAKKNEIEIHDRVSRMTDVQSPEVVVQDGDEVIVNIREELSGRP